MPGSESAGACSMVSDRIMVWRFSEAPERLRELHKELPFPEWLMAVPRSLFDEGLDQSIKSENKSIRRYDTPDVLIYVGTQPEIEKATSA